MKKNGNVKVNVRLPCFIDDPISEAGKARIETLGDGPSSEVTKCVNYGDGNNSKMTIEWNEMMTLLC